MSQEERFFIRESVRCARSMPYAECLRFLRGMLTLCGDVEDLADVRKILCAMTHTDQQLELIASGQLKLGLDSDSLRARRAGRKGT